MANYTVVECTNSEFGLTECEVECTRILPKHEPMKYKLKVKQPWSKGDRVFAECGNDWQLAYELRDQYQEQYPYSVRRFGIRVSL